jgi:RNA polymerase sigma factor (sigma-70 family)
MPRSASDLSDIPTSDFRRLTGDELIGLVAHGRMSEKNGDNERGTSAWKELVLREFDRVTQLVKVFRFPGHPDVRVQRDDIDDAVQIAFMRVLGMDFKGTTRAEFAAALSTCVRYACMDFCRAEQRVDQGLGGSLDDEIENEDGSTRGRFDSELGRKQQQKHDAQEAAQEQIRRLAESLDLLDNDQMREALRLTWAGHPPEEIAEQLQTSVDNVYQLRSRGHRKLVAHVYGDESGKGADGKR